MISSFMMRKHPKLTSKRPSGGFLVSASAFSEKQKELKHLIEVEIPANSKEIGAAIELGDLSENAEYKAGKEKQELLQISVGKLQEEIDKAQVIDKASVSNDKISFGIKASLKNNNSGKAEIYTIMGPWESDPSKNIISYQSPFAGELLGHQKGDNLKFTINEREYDYTNRGACGS